MKTRLSPLLAVLTLAVAGCAVDNMGSVQIYALCSMPDTCTFSGTCDAQYIGQTILDVALQDQLPLAIQVNNQRPPVTPVNTADAHVKTYVTEYSAPAGVAVPGTSGFLSSSAGLVRVGRLARRAEEARVLDQERLHVHRAAALHVGVDLDAVDAHERTGDRAVTAPADVLQMLAKAHGRVPPRREKLRVFGGRRREAGPF